jgi:hypothetical protein
MRTQPEVTRAVRSWLEEGVTRLPDRVLDSVLDQLPTTHQRRPSWSASTYSTMSNGLRLSLAAAAVVVVSVVAVNFLQKAGVGTPTAAPSPAPTSTTLPSPTGVTLGINDLSNPQSAGTYRIGAPFTAPFGFAMPAAWQLTAVSTGAANISTTAQSSLEVDVITAIYSDPCHSEQGALTLTANIDGAVAALTAMAGFTASPAADVLVGGQPAKYVLLTKTVDLSTAGCLRGGALSLWTYAGGQVRSLYRDATLHLWIVASHGAVIIITGESGHPAPAVARQELEAMVQTISFE